MACNSCLLGDTGDGRGDGGDGDGDSAAGGHGMMVVMKEMMMSILDCFYL